MSKNNKSFVRMLLSSPLVTVVLVAGVVVSGISFAGYARRGGFWAPEVEARVFSERGRRANGGNERTGDAAPVFAFQGEVYDEAERLREAAAVTLGLSLVGMEGLLQQRPVRTVEALVSTANASGMLPPGLRVDEKGSSLYSETAAFYVRYRAEPLGVEVISVCRSKIKGPAILLRLPDDGFSQSALTYYLAGKTGDVGMPGAFAPVAEIIAAGWRPESFKVAGVSADELARQREWLAARGGAAVAGR